jgi:hypothetical protein
LIAACKEFLLNNSALKTEINVGEKKKSHRSAVKIIASNKQAIKHAQHMYSQCTETKLEMTLQNKQN